MDLQTRKIEFIQEFLKLQSEDIIAQFENLLKKEKDTVSIKPLTPEELNNRIDQSEDDFKSNRFKTSAELQSKYL